MTWSCEQGGPEERILQVRRRDRRYSRNAYYFVLDALDYTLVHFGKEELTGDSRHVGARELLTGIRDLAAEQFGLMASFVFEQWGVLSTRDFGEIVFNLIDAGLLSRRPEDSRLDFADVYDFAVVLGEKCRQRLSAISGP